MVIMNDELRNWAKSIINGLRIPEASKDLLNININAQSSLEALLSAIPSLPNYANAPGVHTSCAIAKALKSLGHTTSQVRICENEQNNRENKDKADALEESSKIMAISLQTKDLQINELISANNKLTTQNDAYKAIVDDIRAHLDKNYEDYVLTQEKLLKTEDSLSELRESLCESGVIKCRSMLGELTSEPEL